MSAGPCRTGKRTTASFHCFEKDPSSEAAAAAELVVGKCKELRPGHACRHGQGAEHFQHVGQLTGKAVGGGMARLLGLFDELGQQRFPVARLVQDAGNRAAPFGLDDLGNPVTHQLAAGNGHASNLAQRRNQVREFLRHVECPGGGFRAIAP